MVEICLCSDELASLTSVQQVVQFLHLTSTNYSVLGAIEEVSISNNALQCLISHQDSGGELVGAKALWLAVVSKVNVIFFTVGGGAKSHSIALRVFLKISQRLFLDDENSTK